MCHDFLKNTIYKKTRALIADPKKFFKKNKDDLNETGIYLAVILTVPLIFRITQYVMLGFPIEMVFVMGVPAYIVSIVLFGVAALILYFMWKIFGGQGTFEESFSVLVYGSAPYMLFIWAPVLNWVLWIYSAYLIVVGGAIKHKISYLRSALAIIVLPLAILAGIILMIFSYFPNVYIYVTQIIESSVNGVNASMINNSVFYY